MNEGGWETENYESKETLWERARENDGSVRADAYGELGQRAYHENNYIEALNLLEVARDLLEESEPDGYVRQKIHIYEGIEHSLFALGRYADAAEAATIRVQKIRNWDEQELPAALRDLGRVWFAASNFEKSLAAHLEAIELVDPTHVESDYAIDYLNIAMACNGAGKFPDAIQYAVLAREIFKREKIPLSVAECDGELAESYVELGDGINAEHYAQLALDVMNFMGITSRVPYLLYHLGVAKRLQSELDKALELLEESRAAIVSQTPNYFSFLIKIDREVAGILISQGKVGKANEILRRINTIEEIID